MNRLPASLAAYPILLLLAQAPFSFLCHLSYTRLQIKLHPPFLSPRCVLCDVSSFTKISIPYLIIVDRILLELVYTAYFCFISFRKNESALIRSALSGNYMVLCKWLHPPLFEDEGLWEKGCHIALNSLLIPVCLAGSLLSLPQVKMLPFFFVSL